MKKDVLSHSKRFGLEIWTDPLSSCLESLLGTSKRVLWISFIVSVAVISSFGQSTLSPDVDLVPLADSSRAGRLIFYSDDYAAQIQAEHDSTTDHLLTWKNASAVLTRHAMGGISLGTTSTAGEFYLLDAGWDDNITQGNVQAGSAQSTNPLLRYFQSDGSTLIGVWTTDGIVLHTSTVIEWDTTTPDIGLERYAEGELEVTDGSTGTGTLRAGQLNLEDSGSMITATRSSPTVVQQITFDVTGQTSGDWILGPGIDPDDSPTGNAFIFYGHTGTSLDKALTLHHNYTKVWDDLRVVGGVFTGAGGLSVDNGAGGWVNVISGGATQDAEFDDLTVNGTCTGCGSGVTLPAVDTTSIVEGSVDPTKELRFEVDGFTAAAIRVLTPPDWDGAIITSEGAQTITGIKTFNASILAGDTIQIQTTTPILNLYQSDGGVDEKYSRVVTDSISLWFQTVNDAYSTTDTWLRLDRSGSDATLATFGVPVHWTAHNTYDIGTTSVRTKKIYTVDLDISGTCTGCGNFVTLDTTQNITGQKTFQATTTYTRHLYPESDNLYDLGAAVSPKWRTIYAYDGNFGDDVTVGDDLIISGNVGGNLIPWNNNLLDLGSGTNKWRDLYLGDDLLVDDTATFGGDVTLNGSLLTVTNTSVAGTLKPSNDGATDLGSTVRTWATIYGVNLILDNDLTLNGQIADTSGVVEIETGDDLSCSGDGTCNLGNGTAQEWGHIYMNGTLWMDGNDVIDTNANAEFNAATFSSTTSPASDAGSNLGSVALTWNAVYGVTFYGGTSSISGIDSTLSCGAGQAITSLTVNGGIVTAASCGTP